MSKRKYSEVEMIGALKQLEAGRTAADVARELGVSKHTVYAWKAKYGGLDFAELKRVKELEAENAKLKRMYADLALEMGLEQARLQSASVKEGQFDTQAKLAHYSKLFHDHALDPEDFPAPDAPITSSKRAPPWVRRASSFSITARVSSSRPK